MEIRASKGLQGQITPASDKSISHRSVMMGAIAKGVTLVDNFLMGEDCLSTIDCFRKMGTEISISGDQVKVRGNGLHGLKKPQELLYTGNSGTTTRLLCGLLAPQRFQSVLDGDASIRKRPMNRVIEPLIKMGAKISGINGGYTPITIEGTQLHGIEYPLPVASAQLKSALILAGLYADGKTLITEPKPSRNHTELMINGFGGKVSTQENRILVEPTEELYSCDLTVPGDISSAAFFMVAALIVPNSEILIKNVGLNETRTGILDVLQAMGGQIEVTMYGNTIEPAGDILVKSSSLHGTEIGGSLIPRLIDELPVLAVAAAFAEGTTMIKDAEELKVKESNRIEAMAAELTKAGVSVTTTEDGMIIRGGCPIHGAEFESYQDHRIAMSMAVLALAAEGSSRIKDPQCIQISYPGFFETLKSVQR
ncbi:3-phosphoshikimate 1-carboxyvinyltransferase [Sinanaerobacter chloroacetimidivorans]|uniref:3-phosphoshikimate 1-carboxyvinyltransferase n=1 Tax=Sinanaerobacter chloroacetimidivorans TaxID=2818044 RepID=A0A8J7W0I8_9FIRM|nr:3-phosphoshikimate 1-carboxyvinyltransferase [Sinanaerobacter chloroacetimidivorans]MBR0596750.1 3-phosphoshikimate 1-carboxyvinyltransferase [Sinanaerobacter chloroacetimidivorans]